MSRAWMPFYVADYLADTGHLSAAEHGAYLLLIMHYWQNGKLPAEPHRLARIARMTPDEWDAAADAVGEFFDDGWRHERIERELQKAADVSEKAKKKAAKRWGNAAADAAAHTPAMPQECQSQSQSPTEETNVSSETRERKREDRSRVANIEFEHWYGGYPHKVGKAEARKAFEKARRKASLEELIAGRDRYIRDKPPDRSWCNPATFLNQERWTDEPSTDQPQANRFASGHHAGRARGGDAVLAGMARVARHRGLAGFGNECADLAEGPDFAGDLPADERTAFSYRSAN